jgi:6-pyruvoyltetrahydropterin/6-carboxytetrahydropterin synthase
MWELTKSFRFEAAHSIAGTTLGAAGAGVHGHSFRAEVTIRGTPDPATGMVMDLGRLDQSLDTLRRSLDHKWLNDVAGLGAPTLEILARYIWERVESPGALARVTVHRDSLNEAATYLGPQAPAR